MEITRTGSCLCGVVGISVSGQAVRVGLCHCMTCRKESGGPFKHFAVFAKSTVQINGSTNHWTSRTGAKRHFCPHCGSHLFENLPDSHEVEINAGCLDEPTQVPPAYEVWCRRRETWLSDLHIPKYLENRTD